MFDSTFCEEACAYAQVRRGTHEGEMMATLLAYAGLMVCMFVIPLSIEVDEPMDVSDSLYRFAWEFHSDVLGQLGWQDPTRGR